jgi:alkylation response protein AidB-like acyl-CoA dehydrogenase
VRFALTDEQEAFRGTVRELLAHRCPPSAVRAAWEKGEPDDALWAAVAGVGAFEVGPLELTLVMEEAGRSAVPAPLLEHAAVGLPALRDAGLAEPNGLVSVGVALAPLVPDADRADVLVIERDGALIAVQPTDARLERQPSADGARRLFRVTPDGGDTLASDVAAAVDRGALAAAAQLVGIAAHLLEATVEYATQRQQFGVPIGSFQAVQHLLADVAIAVEFARPAVYKAAWDVARGAPDRATYVSLAKARASDAALLAARHSLQVHGAIGYTTESDLHLWMKRAWALAATWGDAAWHRARIAEAIL